MSPWDLLYASNRLIDSSWNLQRDSCIPKALPADQSQPTSSGYANYYAARWLNGHCKYMSRKTIAFWAMLCFLTGQCKTKTADCRLQTADCRLGVKCRLRVKWGLQTRGKMQNRLYSWNLWTFLIYLNDEIWDFYLLLICFNLRKTPPFFQWIKTRHSKTKFLKHRLSAKQEARCRLSWPS